MLWLTLGIFFLGLAVAVGGIWYICRNYDIDLG